MADRRVLAPLFLVGTVAASFGQVSQATIDDVLMAYEESAAELGQRDGPVEYSEYIVPAGEAMRLIAIDELSLEQALALMDERLFMFAPREDAQALVERLVVIADDEGAPAFDRALAAAIASSFQIEVAWLFPEYTTPEPLVETKARLQRAFVEMDAMAGVLHSEHADAGIEAVLTMPDGSETPASHLTLLMRAIGDEFPTDATRGPALLWELVSQMHEREANPISDALREDARVFVSDWTEIAAEAARGEGNDRFADYFDDQHAFFNGRAARNALIDQPAPSMEFRWSSDGVLSGLSDLEGKVVVLDFFATWCGPCIQTFPQVRDLREHYPEEHVAIVMVTSPQGRVYNLDSSGPIDCEGDVAKEIGLFPKFMEARNVTWTMAMLADADVFHPEFGVRGIPHVALIDAEGRVRHNDLRPTDPSKKEKIDGLLKEAGLPVPDA